MNQSKNATYIRLLYWTLFLILPLLPSYQCKAATYYYDVTTLGANGTDNNLDTDAIQEALDMASEENFIVVTIPDGTYYLDDILYIHSNTELRLSKNAIITRKPAYMGYHMLCTADMDYKTNTVGGYDLAHDITITGGTWDGGNINKAATGETSNLIYLGHAKNITIKDTTIKNCYGSHAIELTGVKDSVIRNCYISGFRYGPDKFTAEAIQLDICKYKSGWSPIYEVKSDTTECKNIVIENNTIVDYPRGIGIHHTLSGQEITNIVIRNNTIKAGSENKSVVGVFLLGAKNTTVTNNIFDRCSYGAMVKQSKNVTLTNNQFRYNSLANLRVEGSTGNIKNANHSFIVTKDKIKTKKLVFTCGNIKSGTVKTRSKTYKFTRTKKKVTINLKNNIKANQTIKFYGIDAAGNKYYRTYKVPKTAKK